MTTIFYVYANGGEGSYFPTLAEAREAAENQWGTPDQTDEIKRITIPAKVSRAMACAMLNREGFAAKQESIPYRNGR